MSLHLHTGLNWPLSFHVLVPFTNAYGKFLSCHTAFGTGKFDGTVFLGQSEGILGLGHKTTEIIHCLSVSFPSAVFVT